MPIRSRVYVTVIVSRYVVYTLIPVKSRYGGGGGGVGVARQHDVHSMTASIADFTQLYFTTKSDSKKEYKKTELNPGKPGVTIRSRPTFTYFLNL